MFLANLTKNYHEEKLFKSVKVNFHGTMTGETFVLIWRRNKLWKLFDCTWNVGTHDIDKFQKRRKEKIARLIKNNFVFWHRFEWLVSVLKVQRFAKEHRLPLSLKAYWLIGYYNLPIDHQFNRKKPREDNIEIEFGVPIYLSGTIFT